MSRNLIENASRAAAMGLLLSTTPVVQAREIQYDAPGVVRTAASMGLDTRPVSFPSVADLAPGQEVLFAFPQVEIRQADESLPSQVLDLTNWKITLPSGKATEIKQPALATYQGDAFLVVSTDQGLGIRFRAGVNGGTTSGSGYPRSELREMANNGTTNAAWSPIDGATHTMFLDQAITALPKKKSHIVAGQIHDANDDTVVIRLEGSKLFVNYTDKQGNKNQRAFLTGRYILGQRFQVQMTVNNGETQVSYQNGENAQTVTLSTIDSPDQYFKAGAYTQSNCSTEGQPAGCDDSDNYGEVIIYGLSVTHQ